MPTTLNTTISQIGHTLSKATVRTHTFLIDRDLAKGGVDLEPAGGEYLLVSLGGSFISHFLAAVRARAAAITNVQVVVTGTLEGSPQRFTAFTLAMSAQCADADLARTLMRLAGRACPVLNILRPVVPIVLTYEDARLQWDAAAAG